MSSPRQFTSPLNAAREARRVVETDVHRLVNRIAMLRDEEAKAEQRAARVEAQAAQAAARHEQRAWEKLMWAAAREMGEHPMRAGVSSMAPSRDVLERSARLSHTMGASGRSRSLSTPRSGGYSASALLASATHSAGGADFFAASAGGGSLAATLAARAAAEGAAIAAADPHAPPPVHPVARHAWVATHKVAKEQALASTRVALARRQAQYGSAGRLEHAIRQHLTAEAAAARLADNQASAFKVRTEEQIAREARELAEAARLEALREDYEARIRAEEEAARAVAQQLTPLAGQEAEMLGRVRMAASRQASAYGVLEQALSQPSLPLSIHLSQEDAAAAAVAVTTVAPATASPRPESRSRISSASLRAAGTGMSLLGSSAAGGAMPGLGASVSSAHSAAVLDALVDTVSRASGEGALAATGNGGLLDAAGPGGTQRPAPESMRSPGGEPLSLTERPLTRSTSPQRAPLPRMVPSGLWPAAGGALSPLTVHAAAAVTEAPSSPRAAIAASLRNTAPLPHLVVPSMAPQLSRASIAALDAGAPHLAFSPAAAFGAAAAEAKAVLPPPGIRSPLISTLRAAPLPPGLANSGTGALTSPSAALSANLHLLTGRGPGGSPRPRTPGRSTSVNRGGPGTGISAPSPRRSVFEMLEGTL